jgi:hypothetical protein
VAQTEAREEARRSGEAVAPGLPAAAPRPIAPGTGGAGAGARGYRTVAPVDWPRGYRIAHSHAGAAWAAERLSRLEDFTPILMRVDHQPTAPGQAPGEYLLLPADQEARWRVAASRNRGELAATLRDLAAVSGGTLTDGDRDPRQSDTAGPSA